MPPSHGHHEAHAHVPFRKSSRGEVHHDLGVDYQDKTRRSYSPPSPLRHKTNEVSGSPTWRRGQDRGPKLDKLTYREELEKQMKEKKERELMDKICKEELDKKKDNEIYDPFGKGGCGAPVRDQYGNLVADLKQMRRINENRLSNNSPKLGNSAEGKDLDVQMHIHSGSSPDKTPPHTILTYSKRDNDDVKKSAQDSYRDYLRQQVKEKEELKRKEKERQKIEEQKELDQIERDRKRMQEEYQQELERQRKKEVEARTKNEAIKLEAERERQRVMMQREQEALRESAEQRRFAEMELEKKLSSPRHIPSHDRTLSPPIPTLRHKVPKKSTSDLQSQSNLPPSSSENPSYLPATIHPNLEPDPTEQTMDNRVIFRTSSPPVPTLRKKQDQASNGEIDTSRPKPRSDPHQHSDQTSTVSSVHVAPGRQLSALDSEEILTKLGAIRMHLQEELAKQKGETHSDIFERAKQHKPRMAIPSKSKDSATVKALEDFNKLKFSKMTERPDFLERYPEAPHSMNTHAVQQEPLLRHQQGLRGQPQAMHSNLMGSVGPSDVGPCHPLHLFGNDNDSLTRTSGRNNFSLPEPPPVPRYGGRWDRRGTSPSTLSSTNTYQMDSMATRNEERIRRLEAILKSGMYSGSLDHGQEEKRERRLPYTLPQGIGGSSGAAYRRPSGRSEKSLDCETRHLPS